MNQHNDLENEEKSLLSQFLQCPVEDIQVWAPQRLNNVLELLTNDFLFDSLSICKQRFILSHLRTLVGSKTLPVSVHTKLLDIIRRFNGGVLELLFESPFHSDPLLHELRIVESCVNERIESVRHLISNHFPNTMEIEQMRQLPKLDLKWLSTLRHHKQRKINTSNVQLNSNVHSYPPIVCSQPQHQTNLQDEMSPPIFPRISLSDGDFTAAVPISKEMEIAFELDRNTCECVDFVQHTTTLDCAEAFLQSLFHSVVSSNATESTIPRKYLLTPTEIGSNTVENSGTESRTKCVVALDANSTTENVIKETVLDFAKLDAIKLKLQEIDTNWTNISQSQSFPDLSFFSTTPQFREVCEYLGLANVNDEILLRLSRSVLTTDFSHTRCCIFFSVTFLPKMQKLQQLASRVFTVAVTECASSHSQAFLEAVLIPLLRSNTFEAPQAELLKKVVSECFPRDYAFVVLREMLSFDVPWNDVRIGVLQHLFDMKLNLSDELVNVFVLQLQRQAQAFVSSLPFTALIFHFIKKYTVLANKHCAILREVLKQCSTFLAKKALSLLVSEEP
jgi:hypothetical protein